MTVKAANCGSEGRNALVFHTGQCGHLARHVGQHGGAIGKVVILKALGRCACKNGLFLQGDQDAQDNHYLGQDDHNMLKMIRLLPSSSCAVRRRSPVPL
jgi:hypothetical protein